MPVILVLVAIVTAAALVLFVFPQTKINKAVTVTPKPSSASTPAAHGAPGSGNPAAHKAPTSAGSGAARHPARTPAAGRPASVRLEVLADARVWACLQDQRGRLLINGQILPAGAVSQQFVSPAFRIFLGNGVPQGGDVNIHEDIQHLGVASVISKNQAAAPRRFAFDDDLLCRCD